MTPAIIIAAVLGFSYALGSLIQQADGPTMRRLRQSRRWDVARLARELTAAADEPLATLRGLKHMINAWERGVRQPSERYWLLYLRVFPEANPAAEAAAPDVRVLADTVRTLQQQIAGLSMRLDEMTRSRHQARRPRRARAKYRHVSWTTLTPPLAYCG